MYALMDCNNFFVSCERLFRPDLRRKPVAVLSSNDGCIVARSQEVKDLGVPMGVPYFEVRELCKKEDITLFSSNFKLYRDISDRVMATLKDVAEDVEIYSVDEAFFRAPEEDMEAQLHVLRSRIMREVGIPVSIGAAPTKTIAKYASESVKRGSGVGIFPTERWRNEADNVSCGTIWGIGRQTAAKLDSYNIHTVSEFLAADPAFIEKVFGVHGARLRMELSGVPAYGSGEDPEDVQKSMMSSRSFRERVHDRTVLESAIGYHVSHVAESLREHGYVAGMLTIHMRAGRYSDYGLRKGHMSAELAVPTNSTRTLIAEALRMVRELYDPEIPYKKAGVSVSDIMPARLVSGSLFDDTNGAEADLIDRTLDVLNERYGHGTITFGTVMQKDRWASRAELRSAEYTTKWSDIAYVKAT